jgi:signal transduction histidine kinase
MIANLGLFVGVSLATSPLPLEEFQAAQFVDVFHVSAGSPGLVERSAAAEDLLVLANRILGPGPAQALFALAARRQGKAGGLPDATDGFIQGLERELAGSVGAASAHELVSQLAGRGTVSVDGLMRIADETIQLIDAKRSLERQSRELEETASQLREANAALKRMDALKDAFLSQVSHELRTPMTSIRSFAEILADMPDVTTETAKRFLGIIREESQRLTRLLDEILDLSFLESGRVTFRIEEVRLADVIDRALAATEGLLTASNVPVVRAYSGSDLMVETDFDRVAQVVINLVSNSVKYGCGETPELTISVGETGAGLHIDVADRGPGIPAAERVEIFEKFARLGEANLAGSAGLGLPISREIMRNLGGDLIFLPDGPGATFRVLLPRAAPPVREVSET